MGRPVLPSQPAGPVLRIAAGMEARDHGDVACFSRPLDEEEAERESSEESAPDFDLTLAVNGWKALRGFSYGSERFSDGIKEFLAEPR